MFQSDKFRRDQYLGDVEFVDVEIKNPKNVHIYLAYKELKDGGHKFLTTDQNSPIKRYTVKLSHDFNKIFKRRKQRFYG